jgi:hypothetical protein
MPFSGYQDRALLLPGGRLATGTGIGYDAGTNR